MTQTPETPDAVGTMQPKTAKTVGEVVAELASKKEANQRLQQYHFSLSEFYYVASKFSTQLLKLFREVDTQIDIQ